MRLRRGGMLVELIVSLLVAMLIGAGIFEYFNSSSNAFESNRIGNMAITDARQPIDIVADHIRNAQQYTPDGTTYTVIESAAATSITYYADGSGATVTYALDGTDLERTDSSGTEVVLSNVTSLQFKYFLSNSSTTYYFTDLTESDPSTFTLVERSRVTVVEVSGAVTVQGTPRSFRTQIRLRNSPRKTKL